MTWRGLPALATLSVCFLKLADAATLLTARDILSRMDDREIRTAAALTRYTCVRNYTLRNDRFNKRADMTVKMVYDSGTKTFEIVAQSGPSIIRERVLRKMFEAEAEAS